MYNRITDVHNHRMAILNGQYRLPQADVEQPSITDRQDYQELREFNEALEKIMILKNWIPTKEQRIKERK